MSISVKCNAKKNSSKCGWIKRTLISILTTKTANLLPMESVEVSV